MLSDPNLNYVKDLYKNRQLKRIVNVYQQTYINLIGQGFGDFLRGSIYLTYLCSILGLEFDIDIQNHPMVVCLNNTHSFYQYSASEIEAFSSCCLSEEDEKDVIGKFIEKINNYTGETYYLFNNFKPLFDIENPKFNIIQKARSIIIPKIEPIKFVLDRLDNKLDLYNLKRNQYGVLHIRCGDYFMNLTKIDSDVNKHQISQKHINDIITYINKYMNKTKKYILLGDSNKIKKYVSSKFNNIITFDDEITHLGEDVKINNIAIMETLVDFNMMRFSNGIISFSAYGHGSGFSKYCSSIYDVPFKQIILTPILLY